MKRSVFIVLLAFFVMNCACLAGCEKKGGEPVITAVTPTAMGEISPTEGAGNRQSATPTSSADEYAITAQPAPTDSQDNTEATQTPAPVESPSDGNTDKQPADEGNDGNKAGNETKEPDGESSSGTVDPVIETYWSESFLVWLPKFEKGVFADFVSDETHDLITIGNVSEKDVKRYIKKLTESGFNVDAAYYTKDGDRVSDPDSIKGSYIYRADNEDGWSAQLNFDPSAGTLIVSSGYDIADDADMYDDLRAETPLGLLPEFTYGTFDSSNQDDEMYYVIFANVSGDYAEYVGLLKEAGFTEDADEGDSDGIIWYYAYDENGNFCEFTYTEGMARIGCGTN